MPTPGSLIWTANEKIPIALACSWAGMDVSEGEGNRKLRCPFGEYAHSDSGSAASFRIYEDTNHAFCFACARYWSPVSLMAEVWDCARAEAADRMCKMAGITPPDWKQRWDELHQPMPPDTASLGEALKRWCARVHGPGWETEQFESGLADPLAACLGVLSLVTTDEQAAMWLDSSKLIMLSWLKKGEVGQVGDYGGSAGSAGADNDFTGCGDAGAEQAGGAQDGAVGAVEGVEGAVGRQ